MASNKLSITDLEFDDIKTNLKTYLKSQDTFSDYDFEGSGMSVLIDLLAYNTHYMGYYANMLGNEMFLDSSSLRESVISHAKHLNVIPTSVRAATAYLDFTFTPDGTPVSLTIAKDTKFTSSIDGISYTFVTNKSTTILKEGTNTYQTSDVEIKEGKILTKQYTVDSTNLTQRFIIPNINVDSTTVTVTVQNSITDTGVATYADGNSLDVTTITSAQKVYFLQEIEDKKYEITFGDGAVGKQLLDGNIIFIEYIVTSAVLANKASTFTASGTVAGLASDKYTLTTASDATGGADIQTIASIKHTAPKLYQAQKRATTSSDYKAILLAERPDIESITVYGGEDASPAVYGKVYIAVKPAGNTVFSAATKDVLKTSILKKSNVVTVIPEIIDPIFYYLLITTTVNYDPVTLLTDEATLKTNIDTSIQSYLQTDLEKFDQKFRYSKLTKSIDNTNSSIRNSKTSIKYQMRITPATLATVSTYTMEFNVPLTKDTLTSTSYTLSDGETYSLVDDSAGIIKNARTTSGVVDSPAVYFVLPSGSTTQGTMDYDTGKIVLSNFNPYSITDGTTSIKMNVTPGVNNQDITPLREQILTYDVTDTASIVINMVAETII